MTGLAPAPQPSDNQAMSPKILAKPVLDTEPATFPLRVACIDTGSNAIRFVAAEFSDRRTFNPLESLRAPVRLGHGVFLTGRLDKRAMEEAIAAFREYRERMTALGVTRYRAVATSAVRESSNGSSFLVRVGREAGIELDTITGSEEGRLVFIAIKNRFPLGSRRWVLVDLGGGSVEVSLVDNSGTLWNESHTMGSVRLLEELADTDRDPGRFRKLLADYVATLRMPAAASEHAPAGMIATGGNIESLAKLTNVAPDDTGMVTISLGDLQRVIESVARLSFRQRVEQLGLREDRADVILPAAVVYERIAVLTGVDRIHVPGVGVKEGVLLDLVDDLAGPRDHEKNMEHEVLTAALNLGRRYFFDEAHAVQVADIAESLFDDLQPLHELEFEDRRVLLAAAMLHDIGSYISRKGHHRHSYYVIKNSELSGLSPREIDLVATVSHFHRKKEPTPDHELLASLDHADRWRVMALTSLLRLADTLDRDHRQSVGPIRATIKKSSVTLEVDTTDELLLDRLTLKRRAKLFTDLFEKSVKLRTRGGEA